MLTDTHPEIEAHQVQLWRQVPPWRKAELLGQMYATVKQLAYQGLRQRHPAASEAELHRRLADLLLGEELAQQVYGPLITEEISIAD
jgi:hypothetical protein